MVDRSPDVGSFKLRIPGRRNGRRDYYSGDRPKAPCASVLFEVNQFWDGEEDKTLSSVGLLIWRGLRPKKYCTARRESAEISFCSIVFPKNVSC